MRVTVAVDVASLAYAIGATKSKNNKAKFIAPQLATLAVVLQRHGMEVDEFQVAIPVEVVQPVGSISPRLTDTGAWFARKSLQWVKEQGHALHDRGIPVTVLAGAHNGANEVGVDVAVVCGVLATAARIATGLSRSEAIVVVTHDSDLFLIARATQRTQVILAGNYDHNARQTLARERVSYLRLAAHEIAVIDEVWIDALLACHLSLTQAVVYDTHTVQATKNLEPPLDACVVVADPYGLACSTTAALGMARLPTMASMREVLSPFGVGVDSPILATIPDVEFTTAATRVTAVTERRNAAWHERDSEFDGLAREFDGDGDGDTRVARSRLPLRRLSPDDHSFGRNAVQKVIKQLATQMVCDIYRCLLGSESRRVVVLTDSMDVTWALHLLGEFGLSADRVVRVGVNVTSIEIVSRGRRHPLDVRTAVLSEPQLAALTRVDEIAIGQALGDRLAESIEHPHDWVVLGLDPESDGIRVRHERDLRFETLIAGGLFLRDIDLGVTIDDGVALDLQIDAAMPRSVPRLAVSRRRPKG